MSKKLNRRLKESHPAEPLPPDLAELECDLARLPLPGSTINRDELLYQAGWAAAEAKFMRGLPNLLGQPGSNREAGAVLPWIWPITSAALAATVWVLLLVPERAQKEFAFLKTAPQANQSNSAAVPKNLPQKTLAPKVLPPIRFAASTSLPARADSVFDAIPSRSPLATYRRQWVQHLEGPPQNIPYDDTPSPPRKTSQDLMRELLPEWQQSSENDSPQNNNHWNWPQQLWEVFS